MNLQPNGLAPQKPQTASNKSESESEYAFTQNTVLSTVNRKVLDEGLRKQWKFFSEDDKIPKDILNLKQYLAAKVLRFWEKNPEPAWIPGAKEEQAFVEAYENMVKIIQGIPAEEADNYSAYMEHRLRLATSTDGGKTLGPLLHEVLSNKVSNPEMKIAAFQAAQALHPERYINTDANDDMDVEHSRNEERKNSKKVTAKSLDGRSFALLVNKSLGKRKRLTGDGDDDDMDMVNNSSDGNVITAAAGTSTAHLKPLEDETFKYQSIPEENIAARAMRVDTRLLIKVPPPQKKKKVYSWMTPEKVENDTETSNKVGTKTSTEFELSDFTTPLTLLSKPNKTRKMTDEDNIEGQDDKFTLDISGPDWVRKW
ncbi:hypothetical protein BCON_0414g00020 [Botryotinia convoluta]|uniref:Uncharacterized protein n=1 Tax=Botryotinia convoluta TaxID=54673 RepID=A0A4Z1HJL2_9HELO|nr:hypothetical protein BCON_0414g00020 [Botryotinia convoluta]